MSYSSFEDMMDMMPNSTYYDAGFQANETVEYENEETSTQILGMGTNSVFAFALLTVLILFVFGMVLVYALCRKRNKNRLYHQELTEARCAVAQACHAGEEVSLNKKVRLLPTDGLFQATYFGNGISNDSTVELHFRKCADHNAWTISGKGKDSLGSFRITEGLLAGSLGKAYWAQTYHTWWCWLGRRHHCVSVGHFEATDSFSGHWSTNQDTNGPYVTFQKQNTVSPSSSSCVGESQSAPGEEGGDAPVALSRATDNLASSTSPNDDMDENEHHGNENDTQDAKDDPDVENGCDSSVGWSQLGSESFDTMSRATDNLASSTLPNDDMDENEHHDNENDTPDAKDDPEVENCCDSSVGWSQLGSESFDTMSRATDNLASSTLPNDDMDENEHHGNENDTQDAKDDLDVENGCDSSVGWSQLGSESFDTLEQSVNDKGELSDTSVMSNASSSLHLEDNIPSLDDTPA